MYMLKKVIGKVVGLHNEFLKILLATLSFYSFFGK